MTADAELKPDERQWFIVGRWQEYEGENRANLLRIIAVGAFYIVQLIHFYIFAESAADQLPFHRAATALAVAWTLVALAILLCLRQHIFPASLKYISTGCDIALLTALAAISSSKANSPLVFIYFLIIVLAALRFSLGLIWCATIGCMLAYLALVGLSDATWFDADHTVAPVEQLTVQLSLALSGIMLGQIIRRVQPMAGEYARRITPSQQE